ncbi:aspartic peptidase domain-containing protein [Bisporella sp. PMI_857]|nr:aspartic peptidase domain-containing protein [Bisporella sp. PMI_857]
MLVYSFVFVILAFVQSATAAFFYYPEWRCVEDHTCSPSKRAETENIANVASTLRLVQRPRKEARVPHDVHVREVAERLIRKYEVNDRSNVNNSPRKEPESKDHSLGSAVGKLLRRVTPTKLLPPLGMIMHEIPKVSTRENKYPMVKAAIPTQENSAGINQDGTDYSYFAEIYLGTRSTPYQLLLDTGAGQTWVMGASCTSQPCKNHNTFGPSDSTTYHDAPGELDIGYGTGDVKGTMATDSFTIAGLKVPLTFGVANETSDDFNNFPIDGILGLSKLEGDYPNFVESLVSSKLLTSNVFGIGINRAADGPNTGEINFGKPNTAKFSGDLKYTPVSDNAERDWAIPFDNVGLGDQKSEVPSRLAYLDTGTSFIFVPPADAKTFHASVPGAVSNDGITYNVPCSTTDSVYFTFSGTKYTVSAKDWVSPEVSGKCTSNIYGIQIVSGAWLLGDTFLKNVYAVFDIDGSRVGLAASLGVSAASSTSSTSSDPTGGQTPSVSSSMTGIGPIPGLSSTTLPNTFVMDTSSPRPTDTQSNGNSAGSPTTLGTASSEALTTAAPGSSNTAPSGQGLNGHQTSGPSPTAAQSSTDSTATSAADKEALAARLSYSFLSALTTIISLITLVT